MLRGDFKNIFKFRVDGYRVSVPLYAALSLA